jgi:hypothetical protein
MMMSSPSEARPGPWGASVLGRRALPRVAISLPVRLHLGELGPLDARARDLGAGGVCVATPSCFAPQDLRRVTLLLTSGRIEVDAEGRWQLEVSGEDGFLTGIRFLDIPEEALERVWDLVHQRSKALAHWLLQQHEFADLNLRDVVDLAHVTRMREIRAGGLLYRQGVRDDSAFVVTCGEVVFERRTPRDRKLMVGRARPGQLLGGLGVVANCLPNETAVADSDVSLLEISRGAFENLQLTSPALAFQVASLVMQSHLRRLDSALGRLVDEDR